MSTSTAFLELNESDITQALCDVLVPRLKETILTRAPGHCMRVTNLDNKLMILLSRILHIACPDAQIYILKENGDTSYTSGEPHLFISSTKLVELRNPLPKMAHPEFLENRSSVEMQQELERSPGSVGKRSQAKD